MDKLDHNRANLHPKCQTLDVFIFDGMNLLDVAGPVQAFASAYSDQLLVYKHRYVSLTGEDVTACCGLRISADGALEPGDGTHDLLIPGGNGIDVYLGNSDLQYIVANWQHKSDKNRIISVCSGALILADAGLLDEQEATTHWARKSQAEQEFPQVNWNLDKIYVGKKRIFTSAGVTTGIDLALSIIGQDWGAKIALEVAQELVVYLKRSGGQSQFSNYLINQYKASQSNSGQLETLIGDILFTPEEDWSLREMALRAKLNARTLSRKFQSQLSMSPVEFVEQVRLDKARELLTSNLALKQVAAKAGFGDVQRMRRAFKRNFGVTLQDYVKSFG